MRPHAGRLVYPVALGLVAVLLTGCWDRIEVNDLAIVKGIALDQAGPNAIELTVALTVPANVTPPGSPGGPEAASPLANHAAQGSTVMEATSVLQEKLSRRLFWAHASVILIGEELARDGVAPVLEFFSRQRQPRLRMVVGVVPGRAADVLATMTPLEVETPEAIREMSTFRTGVFVTLREFLIMVAAEGEEPVAARIENVRTGAVQPGSPMDPTVSPLEEGPLQPAITGTAVFKGDRLVGWLDDHETRGLLWLRDELATATVTVPLGDSRWVSFEMIRAMTQLQPRFAGDRIVMEVRIRSEDDLNENAALVDAADPEVIALLERALERTIRQRIEEAARRVQHEFRSDVFGFGETIRRADPVRWQWLRSEWDRVFPEVELAFDIRAAVRRTGLAARPLSGAEGNLLGADEVRRLLEEGEGGVAP